MSPTRRPRVSDSGLADWYAENGIQSNFEDQYNIIENNTDDGEYNKITFKEAVVPFDENYGHIKPCGPLQDNEYNHIEGIQEKNLHDYSGLKQPLNWDKAHDKNPCLKEIQDTNRSEEGFSHDHLSCNVGNQNCDKQTTDYSHLTSNKHGHAGTEGIHGGEGSKENVTETLADEVKDEDDNSDTEHSYFVLESDTGNKKVKANSENEDAAYNQYFVLEPNREIHNDIKEVKMKDNDDSQYQYCDLQPRIGIDGMKTKVWALDEAQHQYCALNHNDHNNAIDKAKSECHGEDDAQHQYFVLEPKADIQKGEDYI